MVDNFSSKNKSKSEGKILKLRCDTLNASNAYRPIAFNIVICKQ